MKWLFYVLFAALPLACVSQDDEPTEEELYEALDTMADQFLEDMKEGWREESKVQCERIAHCAIEKTGKKRTTSDLTECIEILTEAQVYEEDRVDPPCVSNFRAWWLYADMHDYHSDPYERCAFADDSFYDEKEGCLKELGLARN